MSQFVFNLIISIFGSLPDESDPKPPVYLEKKALFEMLDKEFQYTDSLTQLDLVYLSFKQYNFILFPAGEIFVIAHKPWIVHQANPLTVK